MSTPACLVRFLPSCLAWYSAWSAALIRVLEEVDGFLLGRVELRELPLHGLILGLHGVQLPLSLLRPLLGTFNRAFTLAGSLAVDDRLTVDAREPALVCGGRGELLAADAERFENVALAAAERPTPDSRDMDALTTSESIERDSRLGE